MPIQWQCLCICALIVRPPHCNPKRSGLEIFGQRGYSLKRDAGNTILNIKRKTASANFSACNEPIGVFIQQWYGMTVIKL